MRASCATDWVDKHPNHVVAKWLGHSPLLAVQHYLMTRDTHFEAATGRPTAATNPATHPATQAPRHDITHSQGGNTPSGPATEMAYESRHLVSVGGVCDSVTKKENPAKTGLVGEEGFEPPKT